MEPTLDTLMVALYVEVDDLFSLLGVGKGPGRPQRLTDSELVCLAVAQVMLGYNSERRWLRFAYCRLGGLFPYLASAARLQQAAAGGRPAAGPRHPVSGRPHALLVRPSAPARLHTGAMWCLAGDGQALPTRRLGEREVAQALLESAGAYDH